MRQGSPGVSASPPSDRQLLGIQGLTCSRFGLQEQGYTSLLGAVPQVHDCISLPRWHCSLRGRVGSRQVSQYPTVLHEVGIKATERWAAVRSARQTWPAHSALSPGTTCLLSQVAGVTALACGMISVGSCNGDVTSTILQTIMEKSETELKDTYARWLPLGLGLNHLGKAGQCQHLMVWGTGWREFSTDVL